MVAATSRSLSRDAVRRFYDRFGRRQDAQWFYERSAVERLFAEGSFEQAQRVCEFGAGTGHVAELLLAHRLPPSASYRGCDVSTTMVGLARARLARFGSRAEVELADGTPLLRAEAGAYDRFISLYVLDLLAAADIGVLLREAYRVLRGGGRLCLVSLTSGTTVASRCLVWAWRRAYAFRPELVGGCRPLALLPFLAPAHWEVRHRSVVVAYGVPSEIVVAARR